MNHRGPFPVQSVPMKAFSNLQFFVILEMFTVINKRTIDGNPLKEEQSLGGGKIIR